ncbi:MAG: hypothetical protein R6T78_01830 [Dehalococcoidales bacterium]
MRNSDISDNTWKSSTAGTLNIIAGSFGIAGGIYFASIDTMYWQLPPVVIAIVGIVGVTRIALGAIALMGGIFARKRKLWEMAMAGSIIAILCAPPLGILSTIFVSLSKKEFEQVFHH